MGILIALSCMPIPLFIISNLLAKNYINRLQRKKVTETQAYLLKHREEAEKTAVIKLKSLKRIRRLTALYAVFIGLTAVSASVLMGVIPIAPILLYSYVVFIAVYSRIHRSKNLSLENESTYITENDYPRIYSLAYKAAKELGCPYEIKILLSSVFNVSICKEKNRYLLQIGTVLLNTMTEEELYHIFLHEFSHVSAEKSAVEKEKDYNNWISYRENEASNFINAVSRLYLFTDVVYSFNYMLYDYATSVITETSADRAMAKHGDPKIAASALLKLKYNDMYLWEENVDDEPSIFESETLEKDYLRNIISSFKNAIENRAEYWNTLVDKEIIANNSTHPTLKMRLETIGVSEIKLADTQSSPEYTEESQKALEHIEDLIYEDRSKSYQKDRTENYIEPMERIAEWKDKGMPISADNYTDIISDLRQLGKNKEAEALCDRAISELNKNSSLYASFMKGCFLLHRYDEAGAEYIYNAIENNQNFLEEGLNVLGQFYCYMGMQKELSEYRERCNVLIQKNIDEDSQACYLSKNDKLSKETLPDGMLEDILSFIHSVDEDIIKKIYLVRKTVSDSFFTSAFIIQFYGGTDKQRDEIMHKIFCFLDSYPVEWQFSLFDYFDHLDIKFDKIEGSLVYSK